MRIDVSNIRESAAQPKLSPPEEGFSARLNCPPVKTLYGTRNLFVHPVGL